MIYDGGPTYDVDIRQISKELDIIPQRFRDTSRFGRARPHGAGDSDLSSYTDELRRLRTMLVEASAVAPALSLHTHADAFASARAATERQLDSYDDVAKNILRPLLVSPLEIGPAPTR
jgi:hypothetical protein